MRVPWELWGGCVGLGELEGAPCTEPVRNKDTRRIQTRLQILLHRPLRDHEKDCGEVGKELQKRLGEGDSNHQGKGRKLKHSPDSSTLSFLGDKNFQVLREASETG